MGISIIVLASIFVMVTFILFDNDFLSPSFLLSISFFAGGICVEINSSLWDAEFHWFTFAFLAAGLFIPVFCEAFNKVVYSHKRETGNLIKDENHLDDYSYSRLLVYFVSLISIIIFYLYVKEVIRIAYISGYTGAGSFISFSRRVLLHNLVSAENRIPVILTQSYKLVVAAGYVFLYVFLRNYVAGYISRRDYILLFNPILSIIGSVVINGGRLRILRLFLFGMIIYYLLLCKKTRCYKRIDFKTSIRLVLIIFIILIMFKLLTYILGRGQSISFIEYITSYYGGGIELFNRFLQESVPKHDLIGEETFYHFYDFLRKLNLISFEGEAGLEFQMLGNLRDNVYTAYRRPYVDFGMLGALVLHAITYIFLSKRHYRDIRTYPYSNNVKSEWNLFFYAWIYWVTLFYPFDNYFFTLISLNEIVTIFLCWILFMSIRNNHVVIKFSGKELI